MLITTPIKMQTQLLTSYAVLVIGLLAICWLHVPTQGIIVDGRKGGPSALKNQSSKDEMIDEYNTKTCGIFDKDEKASAFVNAARQGEFPWLVSLQVRREDGSFGHFCMGSFISDKWILSAAHCFADPKFKEILNSKRLRITAGSIDAYDKQNSNFTVKRIFYHSKFDRSSPIGFDVSLIELNEHASIKTSFDKELPFINTVCLPIEGKEFDEGQAVKLAGWGDTESKDPKSKPDKLLTIDLLLTDGQKCADIFAKRLKKVKKQFANYRDFICADYKGQRDACQGDSGASLLEYADGKAVAIGIVSYGLGCATKGAPGVYERVSSLMPWIKEITQKKEEANVQYTLLTPPED